MKFEFVKRIDINNIVKAGIVLAVVIAEAIKPDKDYITRRKEEYYTHSNTTSEEELVRCIKNSAIKETSDIHKLEKAEKIHEIMIRNAGDDRIKKICIMALFEISDDCTISYYKREIEGLATDFL